MRFHMNQAVASGWTLMKTTKLAFPAAETAWPRFDRADAARVDLSSAILANVVAA